MTPEQILEPPIEWLEALKYDAALSEPQTTKDINNLINGGGGEK